jgi:hypothetical protein
MLNGVITKGRFLLARIWVRGIATLKTVFSQSAQSNVIFPQATFLQFAKLCIAKFTRTLESVLQYATRRASAQRLAYCMPLLSLATLG